MFPFNVSPLGDHHGHLRHHGPRRAETDAAAHQRHALQVPGDGRSLRPVSVERVVLWRVRQSSRCGGPLQEGGSDGRAQQFVPERWRQLPGISTVHDAEVEGGVGVSQHDGYGRYGESI